MIPGEGNDLAVVHGAAHGRGIYTARVNAPWLSRGFCNSPNVLACAVLGSNSVRPVMDALVVFNAGLVIPLFECKAKAFKDSGVASRLSLPKPVTVSALLPEEAPDSAESRRPRG